MKYVQGNWIDGTALTYSLKDSRLKTGMMFEDGEIKWFPNLLKGKFHDGISCVMDHRSRDFGYMNRKVEFVLPLSLSSADDFSEQRALVCQGDLLLIDTEMNTVARLEKPYVMGQFSEGFAVISEIESETAGETKRDGLVDRQGRIVIQPHYRNAITNPRIHDCADSYSQGLIRMKNGEKYGFVNTADDVCIPFMYNWASRFSDGFASVQLGERYGFIDKTNYQILDADFEDVHSFSEGLAAIKLEGYWGFFNRDMHLDIIPEFECVGDFRNGLAKAKIAGKQGLIDIKGEFVIPPIYDVLSYPDEGLMKFIVDGKEGVRDLANNKLISDFVNIYSVFGGNNRFSMQ
jgi:hypothetical protein